jgi:hypothetical protein
MDEILKKWILVKTEREESGEKGNFEFIVSYFDEGTYKGLEVAASRNILGKSIPVLIHTVVSKLPGISDRFIEMSERDRESLLILLKFQVSDSKSISYSKIVTDCPKDSIRLVLDFWGLYLLENSREIEDSLHG